MPFCDLLIKSAWYILKLDTPIIFVKSRKEKYKRPSTLSYNVPKGLLFEYDRPNTLLIYSKSFFLCQVSKREIEEWLKSHSLLCNTERNSIVARRNQNPNVYWKVSQSRHVTKRPQHCGVKTKRKRALKGPFRDYRPSSRASRAAFTDHSFTRATTVGSFSMRLSEIWRRIAPRMFEMSKVVPT